MEVWDLPATESHLVHTRLFRIKPAGIGTPFAESMTSYIANLALAHSVTPLDLLRDEILPHVKQHLVERQSDTNLCYFPRINSLIGFVNTLNSIREAIDPFITAMELLTGIKGLHFLTMRPWSGVLSKQELVRNRHAWCSQCYQEQLTQRERVYDPLIWSLQAVTICMKHSCFLTTKCPFPDCGIAFGHLTQRYQPGYCPRCNRWLGNSLVSEDAKQSPDWDWQKFCSEAIGDLIACGPFLVETVDQTRLRLAIRKWAEAHFGGSLCLLLQAASISQGNTLASNYRAKSIILWELLRFCYYFGFSLRTLVVEGNIQVIGLPRSSAPKTKPVTANPQLDNSAIQVYLEDLLARNQPQSLAKIAATLGIHQRTLRKNFPQQAQALAKQYEMYRRKGAEEDSQNLCAKVRQVVLELHQQGIYPSSKRVGEMIGGISKLRKPMVQKTWRESKRELGY